MDLSEFVGAHAESGTERPRSLIIEGCGAVTAANLTAARAIGDGEAWGAWVELDELYIWGIAHSGPAWLAPTWGGRSLVPIWTKDMIVHVTEPGWIAVRSAGKLIGALERGVIRSAAIDVF